MTCPHCQVTLYQDMAFCPSCGHAIGNAASVPSAPPVLSVTPATPAPPVSREAVRAEEMRSLNAVIAFLTPVQSLFDRYDRVADTLIRYNRGARKGLLIWGCIVATIGMLFLFFTTETNYTAEDMAVISFLMLFPGLAMVGGGIGMLVNNHVKRSRSLSEYRQICEEFSRLLPSMPTCTIGLCYCNPRILNRLLAMMQYGHADTAKEALNLCLPPHSHAATQRYFFALQHALGSAHVTGPLVFLHPRFVQ